MTQAQAEISLTRGLAAAAAVEAHRAAAVEAVSEVLEARCGDTLPRLGEAGRRDCREELSAHLDCLTGSLIAGTPAPFADHLLWLRDVLATRGVPTDSLALSPTLLGDFLRARLEPTAFTPVEAVLEYGQRALGTTREAVTLYPGPATGAAPHPAVEPLAKSLTTGAETEARELVAAATRELGYTGMAVSVLQPAMYLIGDAWQRHEISVAQEHLAAGLAQRLLAEQAAAATPRAARGPLALFACVPENQHALGLRIVADTFRLEGWAVEFLGADTPAGDLIRRIDRSRPLLVGLSVSMVRQLPQLREITRQIRERMGEDAPRLIGGGLGLARVAGVTERLDLDAWYPTADGILQAPP